jgi:hypothetical protein
MAKIEETLAERKGRYGSFREQARIATNIRNAMADSANWHRLEADQVEALILIANKVSRILNGDPNYHDSWHDIVGYAKLVADRLSPVVDITMSSEEINDRLSAPLMVWGSPAEEITDE